MATFFHGLHGTFKENIKTVIISKRNDKNEIVKYYFNANAWFDSKKDDKAIVREFLAQDENGNNISKLSNGFHITLI